MLLFLSHLVWAITFFMLLEAILAVFALFPRVLVRLMVVSWRITPISILWFPFMFYPPWSSALRIQCCLYFFWLLNQAVTLGYCLPPSSMSPTELCCDFTRVIGQVGRRESGARFWAAHMFWHGWDLCVTFKQKKRANPSLGGLGHFFRLREFTAVIQDFWAHQHNVLIPCVSISFLWNQGPDCGTADLP